MTPPLIFTFQSIAMSAAANNTLSATNATMAGSGAQATIDWDNEPTNPRIQAPALDERTIVESRCLPYEVAHEMLTYDSFGITTDELSRFERWLGEKRFRVGFFTKGIELLVQMRREIRMDQEITQVMPAAARRRI